MKKLVPLALMLAIALPISGCASQPANEEKDTPPASTTENNSPQKPAEPLTLDKELSENGLTVRYPSSWELKEKGTDKKATTISPQCGGIVSISPPLKLTQSITPESTDSDIDSFAKGHFEKLKKADLPQTITGDYKKIIDGDTVIITAPLEFLDKGAKYVGFIYLGVINEQIRTITAAVPVNAEEQYKKTIEAIVDTAKFVKVEAEKPETSDPSTEKQAPSTPAKPTPTVSQSNAHAKALKYLDYAAFSYTGLIKQLEYEKFSTEDATYGADNCGADWNKQAAKKAQEYLDYSSFSRDGLIDQLVYEGFTYDQAVYGVDSVGL